MTDAGLDVEMPEAVFDLTGLLHAARWPIDIENWAYRFHCDPVLAAEMAVCKDHGISHSHFLGGPAVWTDDDRAKAIAYKIHEGRRCQECGVHPFDWPEDQPPDDPPYEPAERFCPGCEEMARYARWRQSQGEGDESAFDGKRPFLRRREGR